MKKFVLITATALLASAMLAEASLAQENVRPRKPNFLERLFGVDPNRPRRQQERKRAWWEDDESGVRVIRGGQERPKKKVAVAQKKKVLPAVEIDPEAGEGLGMGNRLYIPPKQLVVFDPAFSKLTSASTDASFIRVVLADRTNSIRASEDVRKTVLAHYKDNGFKPLWTENGNVSARGLAVLEVLAKSGEEGLEPLRYKPAVLNDYTGAVSQLDGDGLGLAQFDVGLTVAAVTYAQHQSGGAFEPERVSAYHDLKSQRVSPTVALKVLAYTPYPAEYLKQLAPTHRAYAALKAELAKLQTPAQSSDPVFEEGKRVRIGQKDARIELLRERLVKDGYISLSDATVDSEKRATLDKVLARGLKRFQEAKAIPQTSNLDAATVKALNGPDTAELRDKLLSSMERARWMPDDLGARHVFVNQASYRVNVMENDKLIWASNVIVGKPMTQTAVFSDTFETVVFNPTWGVPQSIILKEYLPKLRANPGYLDKIGFKAINAKGKPVSSREINWNQVGANSGIGIMQPAGGSNALGEVKFLFPNSHSIYMHDTPNRELFAKSVRNFSHGCVRVENPREFAEVLLEMDRAQVDAEIDAGATKTVKVTKKTEVHLAYFTAWPDENGIIQYHSDAYGRDQTLKQARDLVFKQAGGNRGQKLVQNTAADLTD